MKKIRVYLDNCCFNRPYDDQSYETIRLESEAKLFIQDSIKDGKITLVWSFMLDIENTVNPYEEIKDAINAWKNKSNIIVVPEESIRDRAKKIEKSSRIKAKDALHIACAVHSTCDYFITTDKMLLKKSTLLKEIQIINPVDFIAIVEEK